MYYYSGSLSFEIRSNVACFSELKYYLALAIEEITRHTLSSRNSMSSEEFGSQSNGRKKIIFLQSISMVVTMYLNRPRGD